MELTDAIKKRRMVRAYQRIALPPGELEHLLDLARRAPSAGNTQAVGFIVLDNEEAVERYWSTTLPEPKRSTFRWQNLLSAPAIVIVTVNPQRYLDRYSESDKAKTGLGKSSSRWAVPYWWVDAGAVAQNLLLLATDAGLGACLFGPFDHEPALSQELQVPADTRLVATVAIGYPLPDEPGRSAGRVRPQISDIIVRP